MSRRASGLSTLPATRPKTSRTRSTSAGTIFVVGLVCFGIWLFLDARQLYQSAVASPLGTRRSVSMAILRPIARVEEATSLDRIVNAVDRIIGKTGTPGGSAFAPASSQPLPTVSSTPASTNNSTRSKGTGGRTSTRTNVPPSTRPAALAPLLQPSSARPLTILDIGDSIGEDLGIGLADELGNSPHVRLLTNSVGDTGLANLGYFNWLAQLPVEMSRYHPRLVIVMLGGNDAQSFQAGSLVVQFGSPAWRRIYRQRVGELMSEATSHGAHLVWVGLPIMGPTSGLNNVSIEKENAVFASEAELHPGVIYVSSWNLFQNSSGQYATYLQGPGGGIVQVRDADEVHIDPPGGTDLIGADVVKQLESDFHIRL